MNNLYEYLTDTRNMAKEKGSRLWQALTNQNEDTKPQIEPIQLDQSGNNDPQASLDLKARTQPRSLWEHLTGRNISIDNQTINQPLLDYQNQLRNQGFDENTVNGVAQGLNSGNKDIAAKIDELGINKPLSQADIDLAKQGQFNTPTLSTETISQFQPGFFNNFGAGFKENFSTPISANNFGQNTLDDGRRKGFSYRAGEALGTFGRLLESPLGRGLLTAGIVGATGGSGLEALAYGGQAGLINQTSRMNNQMYRNTLKNDYGYSDEDLGQVRGYINNDTFNNIVNSNYKSNMNTYRNKKLDQNSYIKMVQNLETLHKTGQISNETFLMSLQGLNDQFIDSNTYDISDITDSNDTRKTDSTIKLNDKRGKYLDTMGSVGVQNANTNRINANTNRIRANKYAEYIDNKLQGPDGSALAEFQEILQTNDKNKIQYARKEYIKRFNKDPYKLLNMDY